MEFETSPDLWLSVRPQWADLAISGEKTVELRRHAPSTEVGRAVLYATAPTSSAVAVAEIRDVVELPTLDLFVKYGRAACVTRVEFENYLFDRETGFAIVFGDVWPLALSVGASKIKSEFGIGPVQGWRYVSPEVTDALLALPIPS